MLALKLDSFDFDASELGGVIFKMHHLLAERILYFFKFGQVVRFFSLAFLDLI
jgi:hypothetical protein